MKSFVVAIAIACIATIASAAELGVRIQPKTMNAGLSTSMQVFCATAAYAIDANVADASAHNGTITLFGRSAGKTQIVVVTLTGQTTFELTVIGRAAATPRPKATNTDGRLETRYVSAGEQLHNNLTVVRDHGGARTELHVQNINYGAEAGSRATTTLPSVSYRIFTKNREITFLDRIVDHSPLTIEQTAVRGIHYIDDRWAFHAGVTSYAAYQSFLLPAERTSVLGAAYTVPLRKGLRLTSSAFFIDSEPIASLLVDYARGDVLTARGEIAIDGGGVGAAAQLDLNREDQKAHVDLRYTPRHHVVATPGEPRGFFADSSWSKTFARGSSADAALSIYDFTFGRSITATANGRYCATDSLTLIGGGSYGAFDATRTFSIPLGVQIDRSRFGVSASARWSQSSSTNRGGLGYRIGLRTNVGRVFASAYFDRQHEAPTLSVIFREQPDLALALEQLGITATTPDDIARALREQSALVDLGFIEGVTIDLAPSRTQAGLELAWLGSGASRAQVRLRVIGNRIETVATQTDTVIATLSASRRLTASSDIFASYSWWRTDRNDVRTVRPIVEAGIRYRFDSLPSFGLRGSITGSVVLDENLDGEADGVLAGAEIELDGGRKIQTAKDGSFAFNGVAKGDHVVVARLPDVRDAFFTTPSRVDAQTGDVVRFGVAPAAIKLFGRVVSDAGEGVGAIGVSLTSGSIRRDAVTASDGSFSIAGTPGAWTLAIDTATLPAGFSMIDTASRAVTLDRTAPAPVTMMVRANRSLTGYAPGVTSVTVEPQGIRAPVAPDGRFTVRSLPAGEMTVRAGATTRRVTLPSEPASVSVDMKK